MNIHRRLIVTMLALTLPAISTHAEQMQRFGAWEVHYIVLPSGFLKPEIAAGYSIIRGRDRAFINISVLDAQDSPTKVTMVGHTTNLLGQQNELMFRQLVEADAVYYLAELKHSDEETLRFEIHITPPEGRAIRLKFQQKLYWEEP